MKRSEMISKIAECLIEPHSEDVFEEADFILNKIEKAGMFPPEYNTRLKSGLEVRMLDWEPEDES